MRRLGRALLRAPWARRTAALTLTLGLLAGNSVIVATTVLAATPGSTGGLLQLGSLGLGGGDGSTSGLQLSSLTQTLDQELSTVGRQVCQALQVTCQAGTRVFEIPTGVLTLGMPRAHPHSHAPLTGTALSAPRIPSTGCILGIIGCGHPSSTPAPKASAAATVGPSPSSSSTTTTSTTTKTTTSAPTATPSPAAGGCLLGLLGSCSGSGGGLLGGVTSTLGNTLNGLVGGTSNSTATASPAPLCILTCGLVQLGGSGCSAALLQSCILPSASTPAAGGGSSSGSGSGGGACVATLCLLGSSCTLSAGSTCLLGALLPGLPGLLPGSPSGPSSPGSSNPGGSSQTTGGTGGGAGSTSSGTAGGLPLLGDVVPAGSTQNAGGGGGQAFTPPQTPGGDAIVGLVNGITFGHGLILWPLFGLLDLAALAGLVVVVRRRWSANPV